MYFCKPRSSRHQNHSTTSTHKNTKTPSPFRLCKKKRSIPRADYSSKFSSRFVFFSSPASAIQIEHTNKGRHTKKIHLPLQTLPPSSHMRIQFLPETGFKRTDTCASSESPIPFSNYRLVSDPKKNSFPNTKQTLTYYNINNNQTIITTTKTLIHKNTHTNPHQHCTSSEQ